MLCWAFWRSLLLGWSKLLPLPRYRPALTDPPLLPGTLTTCPPPPPPPPAAAILHPNELYPTWPWPDPATPCAPAHEKIRIAAARLATYVANNALSQRQVAERVGLTHVVIFDFVRGRYWPRTLLIAQVETALGIELWPRIGETE